MTYEVIKKAKEKYSKTLFSTIDSVKKPALICTKDMQTEAEFICQRILELQEEDVPLDDIAVLASSARMTYNLEIELAKNPSLIAILGGRISLKQLMLRILLRICALF